jgi:hypothetical protein
MMMHHLLNYSYNTHIFNKCNYPALHGSDPHPHPQPTHTTPNPNKPKCQQKKNPKKCQKKKKKNPKSVLKKWDSPLDALILEQFEFVQ